MQAFEIGDQRLEIHTDDDPMDPRSDGNLGTMICFHPRYNLGDDKSKISELTEDTFVNALLLMNKIRKNGGIVLPLYLLDHSGITMSTTSFNDKWDSGQVGFIYVTKKKLREERMDKDWLEKYYSGKTREEVITALLIGEVTIYDQFLTGDVYGFKLFEKTTWKKEGTDVTKTEWEEIDACWGFYGSDFKTNGMFEHLDSKWINAPEVKQRKEYSL